MPRAAGPGLAACCLLVVSAPSCWGRVVAGCSMHVVEGKACTNAAKVKIIGRPPVNSSDECCAACAAMPACGAWTFHAASRGGSCLAADRASSPGQIHGATCGSKGPLPPPLNPPAPPHPPHPPLPPLPKPPPGLQVASLQLEYLLRPLYMEYIYVEFVCKCIYVYFTYILDGAGTSLS